MKELFLFYLWVCGTIFFWSVAYGIYQDVFNGRKLLRNENSFWTATFFTAIPFLNLVCLIAFIYYVVKVKRNANSV